MRIMQVLFAWEFNQKTYDSEVTIEISAGATYVSEMVALGFFRKRLLIVGARARNIFAEEAPM